MERVQVDIRENSFQEFVAFIFDHEIQSSGAQRFHPWYCDVEVLFDARRVCEFYIQLFRNPDFLVQMYSKDKLEQGFWAIHGDAFDCSSQRIIADTDIPFSLRCECIRSMADLFTRFFAIESLETSVFMWWDSLCYDWHSGVRDRSLGGEDESLQDVFFEVLSGLLRSDSKACQDAALHGLGHLHHPKTSETIEAFLSQHSDLGDERRTYALSASRFEVL